MGITARLCYRIKRNQFTSDSHLAPRIVPAPVFSRCRDKRVCLLSMTRGIQCFGNTQILSTNCDVGTVTLQPHYKSVQQSHISWMTHIKAKRCQLQLKLKNMSWLITARSQLSLDSKLTVYKAILRPIWTYGMELWGCSKPSNTKILQTFQSKMLRMISSAPLVRLKPNFAQWLRYHVRNGSGSNQRQQIQKPQQWAQ